MIVYKTTKKVSGNTNLKKCQDYSKTMKEREAYIRRKKIPFPFSTNNIYQTLQTRL
jgi:hypothetical protein